MRNRSLPEAAVIPVHGYPDVPEASGWLCDHFGLRVRLRIADHRVQLVRGDGAAVVTSGELVDGAVSDGGGSQ